MTIYSNPRMRAEYENWPNGGHRVRCVFAVEQDAKRGERATRVTYHPTTGRPSSPKKDTYASRVRIVDGDDGRTYVVRYTGTHFSVMQSNLQYQHDVIFPGQDGYSDLMKLMR